MSMSIKNKKVIKWLVVLILIFILGMGVYVAYEKNKEDQWGDILEFNPIFYFPEDKALKWELLYDGQHVVVEKKKDNDFWVIRPELQQILEANFLANVKNFNSTGYYSIIEEGKSNLAKWGIDLNTNYYRIYYKDGLEEKFHTIYRGNPLGFAEGNYIYHDQTDKVYSSKSWVVAALEKDIYEIRSDFVFRFLKPERVIGYDYEGVSLRRIRGGWTLVTDKVREKVISINVELVIIGLINLFPQGTYLKGEKEIDFEENRESVKIQYLDLKKQVKEYRLDFYDEGGKKYMKISGLPEIYMVTQGWYRELIKPKGYYFEENVSQVEALENN